MVKLKWSYIHFFCLLYIVPLKGQKQTYWLSLVVVVGVGKSHQRLHHGCNHLSLRVSLDVDTRLASAQSQCT